MWESVKHRITQIDMISSTLCHIEAEGKNIPWNTPVALDIGDMQAASPTTPTGFDCAKADWSQTIKPANDKATMDKHQACDAAMMEEASSGSGMSDCFSDQTYRQDDPELEIEFSEEAPGAIELQF